MEKSGTARFEKEDYLENEEIATHCFLLVPGWALADLAGLITISKRAIHGTWVRISWHSK
jgi:hypothetical protein